MNWCLTNTHSTHIHPHTTHAPLFNMWLMCDVWLNISNRKGERERQKTWKTHFGWIKMGGWREALTQSIHCVNHTIDTIASAQPQLFCLCFIWSHHTWVRWKYGINGISILTLWKCFYDNLCYHIARVDEWGRCGWSEAMKEIPERD